MIEKFRNKSFHSKSTELIRQADAILQEYAGKNISVTLRQLYYQLVTKTIIKNKDSEYRKLSWLMTDARYAGLVDWNCIEDRTRIPKRHSQFEDIKELIDCAARSYRLDRWKDQSNYIELWTEKDALSSVLYPIAEKHHVYFCVNRGFDSSTAMYDASCRIREAIQANKSPKILYLGDHDPSGLNMIKDIGNRLNEFLSMPVTVEHIALTKEQVDTYKPPPNAAKETDPRYKEYQQLHGGECWEVDALPPDVMIELVDRVIDGYVDKKKRDKIIKQEQKDVRDLKKLAA